MGNRRVQHQFLAHLQQLRIRNRDFIAFADRPDDWQAAKSLYAKATRKPKLLGLARWVRSNPLSGQLVTFYRPAKGRKHLTVQKRPAKSKQSRQQAKREEETWMR